MHAWSAILLCVFAVLGLYAFFSRLMVMLSPRGDVLLAIDGRKKSVDEILLCLKGAEYLLEREVRLSERPCVLLSEQEEEKMDALRKEGVLVYALKMPYS